MALGELGERAVAHLHLQRRYGEREQQRRRGARGEDRVAHDRTRPALPERSARSIGVVAAQAAEQPSQSRGDRRRPAGLIGTAAGQRDQRRQQRRRRDDRDRDDQDRAERHRAHRHRVDDEQPRERDDDGQARERHRDARGGQRGRARRVGILAGGDLLAITGEHEQRVVDRDADADHRRHVGDEHAHARHQRERVDQRTGDRHRDDPERDGQQRRGDRAEDRQQDQQDDGEPDRLGRGEVLLGEVLHARPQRALADEVGHDRRVWIGVQDPELLAKVDGDVDRIAVGDRRAERDDQRADTVTVDARERCSSRGGGEVDLRGRAGRRADLGDRRTDLRWGGVLSRDEHGGQRRGLSGLEVPLDGVLHSHRLRAGDIEAATAEVVGLAHGERDGGEDDERPRSEDQTAATADQAI